MDFSTITNLNAYTKNLKLQTQWNMKKKSGNVNGHMETTGNWMLDKVKENQENSKMSAIGQKMLYGKKLTKEELDYLREKNPQAYQQYLQNQQEEKAYEQELRHCKTKDEVQRLQTNRINAALATVKAVENNPHISSAMALSIAQGELAKIQSYQRITKAFMDSGEYGQLPTEAEEAIAREQEREAREAQLDPAAQEQVKQPEQDEAPDEVSEEAAHAEKAPVAAPAQKKAGIETTRTDAARQPERPAIDVESPEQRKVRRARAKAAYAAVKAEPEDTGSPIDIKA